MPLHPESTALWTRAQRVLAGGPSTLSKHPARFPHGIAPLFLADGDRAMVWDVDGGAYLDCIGALGPVILGHSHPQVMAAVRAQVGRLASSSLSTRLEVDVAEQLVDSIPGAECVRFASNGYDVTNAAIKVARYVTGKQHVIFCGYHGQSDSYLSTTEKAGGILPQIQSYNHQVPWGDFVAMGHTLIKASSPRHGTDDVAAVMLEVPPEPYGRPSADTATTLATYQALAHEHGALFILDEIVTWGRYGLGGAQQYYGVRADMVCLSKALGNGVPISAITGPRELMRVFEKGQVFLSTTFGASPLGLAACKAVLTVLPHEYRGLVEHGGAFVQRLSEYGSKSAMPATLRGMHGRMVVDWSDCEAASAAQLKTLWMQEMLSRGVLVSVVFLPMTCWRQETVDRLMQAVEETCMVIADVVRGKVAIGEALRCAVVGEVFERYGTSP